MDVECVLIPIDSENVHTKTTHGILHLTYVVDKVVRRKKISIEFAMSRNYVKV